MSVRRPWLFRTARPASLTWNLAKTGVQLVLVWTFALVLLPSLIERLESEVGFDGWDAPWSRATGWAALLVASTIGVWAAVTMARSGRGTPVPFDAARHLVTDGPYRSIRNPMAATATAQILAVALIRGSPGTAAMSVMTAVGWQLLIRPTEEPFLEDQFGDQYREYQQRVPCWWPRVWPRRRR